MPHASEPRPTRLQQQCPPDPDLPGIVYRGNYRGHPWSMSVKNAAPRSSKMKSVGSAVESKDHSTEQIDCCSWSDCRLLHHVAPFNCCKKNEKHASKDFNQILQKISKNSIVTSGQLMSTPMHLGWNRNHHLCNRFWRLLVSRHGHLVSFNMSQPLEPGTIGSMNISSPQKSESCLIGKAQEDSFSSFDHAPNLAISTYQMTYISTFELGNTDRRILQLLRFYVWKLEDTR